MVLHTTAGRVAVGGRCAATTGVLARRRRCFRATGATVGQCLAGEGLTAMDDESARRELEQDSDYDGVWKEALREHLAEFVEKYFPTEHAAIDWSHEPQWYDKELSQVLGQSGQRNRRVDLLARVRLQNGQEQWILLHVEIQTSYEPDFAVRISLYNAGLYWVFKRRVLTLVVLADLTRGWRPEEDVFQVGTFESRLKFPVCKLIERLGVEWHDDHTLPVLLARAQIEALRTAGDPEGRYRAKWLLVRGLYDLGYNAQQVREIFRLIDWMMHLRVDLEAQFEQGSRGIRAGESNALRDIRGANCRSPGSSDWRSPRRSPRGVVVAG